MLRIYLKPNLSDDPAESKIVHVIIGQTNATKEIIRQHELIDYIVADRLELVTIFQNFTGIPFRTDLATRSYPNSDDDEFELTWYGDDARFIVANWR